MRGHTFGTKITQSEGVTPSLSASPRLRVNRSGLPHALSANVRRSLFVLILLALACAKQDDAKKLQKSVLSWKATLQIVADARQKNEVRDGFALKTIDEAVDDLEGQSSKTTNKSAEQLIGIAARLRQAIESDDKAAISKLRGELR